MLSARAHTNTRTHPHTPAHARTHARTHARERTHERTHARTRAHTHNLLGGQRSAAARTTCGVVARARSCFDICPFSGVICHLGGGVDCSSLVQQKPHHLVVTVACSQNEGCVSFLSRARARMRARARKDVLVLTSTRRKLQRRDDKSGKRAWPLWPTVDGPSGLDPSVALAPRLRPRALWGSRAHNMPRHHPFLPLVHVSISLRAALVASASPLPLSEPR